LATEKIIQLTEDGSQTVFIPSMNVTYHSKHGAVQESMHVFIRSGLNYFMQHNTSPVDETINIFEVGFGTGLNALLSLKDAILFNKKIFYETIEPFPLSREETLQLNYSSLFNEELKQSFIAMHEFDWNKVIQIHSLFSFEKIKTTLQQFETQQQFHVIYFDAFDPVVQPELWTEAVFKKMFDQLFDNGILVTYSCKGAVQRAMKAAGFSIEKLQGPPGKREIIRAQKSLKK
jgi:tRNA U34 5-methylaminomethyl-2-thiouridine-forming methyltransferase MnmC